MRWSRAVLIATMLMSASSARAEEPPLGVSLAGTIMPRMCDEGEEPPSDSPTSGRVVIARKPCYPPPISPARRVLATALAVSPAGYFVRGAGSFLTHDRRTAIRLLVTAGIGLGVGLAGAIPVAATGGNPYLLVPFESMIIAGAGVFMQSWFADIYNAAGLTGSGVPRARPPYSLEVGTLWVHGAYHDRALLSGAVRIAVDRVELGATGYLDALDRYRAGDLGASVRVYGDRANDGRTLARNHFVDVRTTARLRDDRDDRVQVATFEAEVVGRLDLAALSPSLDGSYAELSTGGGIERAAFATEDEIGGLLLGRFAWGMYLGRRGELELFYDHRRDSLAGGIAAYRAAGFVGSVGTSLDLRVSGPWAVRAELEIGSAWVTSFGIRYQGGER